MSSCSNPKSLPYYQVFMMIKSLLSFCKSTLRSERNMLDKFRISVAKVAKIMDSWFKDTAIIYSYGRGYLNNKKISKRRRVFPARGQS